MFDDIPRLNAALIDVELHLASLRSGEKFPDAAGKFFREELHFLPP
jgi:hypothetical protein